jgi:hypothetical protein
MKTAENFRKTIEGIFQQASLVIVRQLAKDDLVFNFNEHAGVGCQRLPAEDAAGRQATGNDATGRSSQVSNKKF